MPDGSVSFAAPMDGASAPAPVTIAALGYHLGALRTCEDKLDHVRFCAKDRPADPEEEKLRDKRVESAWLRTADEVEAVEDLILASEARTPTDAAVQVMIVQNRLGLVLGNELQEDGLDVESSRAKLKALEHALWSITKACARAAGLRLADVAGDSYAPSYLDPRPDIDVREVSVADLGERRACDGTVPAVEA